MSQLVLVLGNQLHPLEMLSLCWPNTPTNRMLC